MNHIDEAIAARRALACRYLAGLKGVKGLSIPGHGPDQTANHGYFPIIVGPEYPLSRDQLFALMVKNRIMVRKYFFPLLSDIAPYRDARRAPGGLPNARRAAARVLTLPIYPDLRHDQQDLVISILADPLQSATSRSQRHFPLSGERTVGVAPGTSSTAS